MATWRSALTWVAGTLGVAAGAYAGYVGVTWLRYGQPAPATADDADPLLDHFMPVTKWPNVITSMSPRRRISRSPQPANRM